MKVAVHRFVDRHEVAWELAFAALAIVFVALGFVEPADAGVLETVVAIESAITLAFAAEFALRLWAAPHRSVHFKAHWIDLVSLVPPARWLRPFRLIRLLRLVRSFAGIARAMGHMGRLASHRGLVWLIAAWLGVTVLASIGLYSAEHGINEAIAEPLDAVWWAIVTLSTVGYGDVYPLTPEGRIAAMALMVLGIGLYSAITAAVTSYFVSQGAASGSLVGNLERLEGMRDRGSLTDADFRAAKAAILGGYETTPEYVGGVR